MCFIQIILKGSAHLQAKVATRPIRVLKVGRKVPIKPQSLVGFESILFPIVYIPGKIYTQKPPVYNKEFHLSGKYEYERISIEKGFHSYRNLLASITNLSIQESWEHYVYPYSIGLFEIPKGAIYYSDCGLFVSDSIKLIKVIDSAKEWIEANFKPELIL